MDPTTSAPSATVTTATPPPATTGAATPPPAATATGAPVGITSDQLRDRLAEERTKAEAKFLKDLGFEKADDLKALVKNAKAADDANKSEAEKLRARVGELEPAAKRVADLEAVVKARAESELASISEAQRAAVAAIAGEDPAAQLRAITALRPTWATSTAAHGATAPAAAPPPATTAPPNAAPTPAPTTSPTNHKAVYESLKQSNPIAASQYLMRHRLEIYPNKTT